MSYKIKPLLWGKSVRDTGVQSTQTLPWGFEYVIHKEAGGNRWDWGISMEVFDRLGICESEEQAKIACQKDLEKDLSSLIEEA